MKKLVFILILSTVVARAQGQEAMSFSLEEARAYAVEHSYFTQKALLDEEMARKRVQETTAIGLPQVNAIGDFNQFIEIPTTQIPAGAFGGDPNDPNFDPNALIPVQFGTNYSINGGITVTQLIFDGSYIVGLQSAKTYRTLSEQARVKTEREIKDAVTQAYSGVIIAQENTTTLQQNRDYLNQTYTETQALYEAGFAEEQDADQLKILLQSAENQLDRAVRLEEISMNSLKFQMGISNETTITLEDNLETILAYGADQSVLDQKFDITTNIDFQLSETQAELQERNLSLKKMQYAPSLSAFYNYQESYMNNDLTLSNDFWFPTSLWGLQLNVPIFSSFQRKYQVQQAELDLRKSQITVTETEQNLRVDYLTRVTQYEFALNQYKNNKDNLALVSKILDKETTKYNVGMSSSLNLANTQIQFFEIQAAYIGSIQTLIEARSSLDKILNNY